MSTVTVLERETVSTLSDTKINALADETEKPLALALSKIGIQPFTPESVERYKRKKARAWFQLKEINWPRWEFNFFFGIVFGLIVNMYLFGAYTTLLTNSSFGWFAVLIPPVVFCALVPTMDRALLRQACFTD